MIIQIRTVTAEWADLFRVHFPNERVTSQGRKEGRREPEGERERRKEVGGRERSTQYALKLTTVSSLELIQESVSCCLLRPLLTTEPYQVLPLQARVNLGAMAMKGYSAFSKSPRLKPQHQTV